LHSFPTRRSSDLIEAIVEVDIQLTDEVQPVVELGKAQVVAVLVQITVDTAALILVAGPHRDPEGDSAGGVVQVFAEYDHAAIGVVGDVETVGQFQAATVRHAGAAAKAAGVLQADCATGLSSVFAAIEVVDSVVATA